MGRREIGQENVRKIQVTGREGSSYMITLPKKYIEHLGWRENQHLTVTLSRRGNKLIIKDYPDTKKTASLSRR